MHTPAGEPPLAACRPPRRRLDPAKYRIYGCDEKGFTICDEAYNAFVEVSPAEAAAPRDYRFLDYFVQEFSV